MTDIIKILPDSIANQIAAGEVIQRPSSAVKELVENSIDSGADEIKLLIKDAGRTLIQIIDNGCGVSETDARLSFERHATSKIREASDLFSIRTMGFRGEALASIAAIAQVELKSKQIGNDLGTELSIEGSEVMSQKVCQCSDGTSIAVKNLFYNVPARRNFLKADNVERNYINQEFYRIALANPSIAFSFFNNDSQIYRLEKSNLKQRIVGLFGTVLNERLLPIEQKTNLVNIYGFIAKPEFAKKTRGEQYFFVNKRFIKSNYLQNAVDRAFEGLVLPKQYPSFFIFIDIDPEQIDINVHPTKTEIKFQDEKSIYLIINSVVKQSIGKYNLKPSIDFNVEGFIDSFEKKNAANYEDPPVKPAYSINKSVESSNYLNFINKNSKADWVNLYKSIEEDNIDKNEIEKNETTPTQLKISNDMDAVDKKQFVFQLQNKYLITAVKSGLMIIDQQNAHERILFEKYLKIFDNKQVNSQTLLFPINVELTTEETAILNQIIEDINKSGFDIAEFGKNSFIINAIPTDLINADIKILIEDIISNFRENINILKEDYKIGFAKSLSKNLSIKSGKILKNEEMESIINELFLCETPNYSADGKPSITIISTEELNKKFNK